MLEIEPAGEARHCCIVLHGLGADGSDLRPLAPDLWPDPGVRWLFPDAPVRPIAINGGMPMRGWYDVRQPRLLDEEDEDGVRASAALVAELVAAQRAKGLDADRIALVGFSQGGAMALHAGLRLPEAPLAVVGLSCYLPLPRLFAAEASAAARSAPVFLGFGEADEVISPADTLSSGQQLAELGYSVEAEAYPVGHGICPEEVQDVARFLARAAAG